MTNEQISNMSFKVLLYEMERRRIFLEANNKNGQYGEIEKQLQELNKKKK